MVSASCSSDSWFEVRGQAVIVPWRLWCSVRHARNYGSHGPTWASHMFVVSAFVGAWSRRDGRGMGTSCAGTLALAGLMVHYNQALSGAVFEGPHWPGGTGKSPSPTPRQFCRLMGGLARAK